MLTDINLDDEKFDDLVEEAKNLVASVYPEWTDFNHHDPGITISELFALLKEIAQYRMNYIDEAHRVKYLKLMGMERKMMQPAQALISIDCKKTQHLPALTRFYASDICFESKASKYLIASDLCGCAYTYQETQAFLDRRMLGFTKTLKIPAFGMDPQPGNAFYIMFDEELPKNTPLSLYAEVYNGYRVQRNPLSTSTDFRPLAVMAMEYYSDGAWHLCEEFADSTWGFLQNGWLEFQLPEQMDESEVAGHRGFFLRLRLKMAAYDVAPVVTRIGMNFVEVLQTKHYAVCQDVPCVEEGATVICRVEANEINTQNLAVLIKKGAGYEIYEDYTLEVKDGWITVVLEASTQRDLPKEVRILSWEASFDMYQIVGDGDGLPSQSFDLFDVRVEKASFRLMADELGENHVLYEWQQVQDFSNSGPLDRHFVVDHVNQQLVFGDCIHGMAPEGRILIVQFVSSEGWQGNVKAGKINEIEEGYEFLHVTNEDNAYGGRDEENLEDSFMRAQKAIYDNGALVTDEDYENAVRKTPGLMIENCKVLHQVMSQREQETNHRLTIVVKPYSEEKNPQLTLEYQYNILAWLDPVRMVGTDIHLVSPDYVKLNLFLECKGHSNYIYDRKAIISALNTYFQLFGTNFGGVISYSEVYELLDRLDTIEEMGALSIEVIGSKVGRTLGGDIILPPNGLISVDDIQYNINLN